MGGLSCMRKRLIMLQIGLTGNDTQSCFLLPLFTVGKPPFTSLVHLISAETEKDTKQRDFHEVRLETQRNPVMQAWLLSKYAYGFDLLVW